MFSQSAKSCSLRNRTARGVAVVPEVNFNKAGGFAPHFSSVEAAVLSGKFKNSSAETADTTVRRLVSEMPDTGEDHRHFAFVGGSDHFLVADGTARLNRASRACIRRGD